MKRIRIIVLTIILALAACFGCAKEPAETQKEPLSEIDLVKDGKTEYSILLPEEAEEYEQTAADELRTFFEMATGILLEVNTDAGQVSTNEHVFSLGNTKLK